MSEPERPRRGGIVLVLVVAAAIPALIAGGWWLTRSPVERVRGDLRPGKTVADVVAAAQQASDRSLLLELEAKGHTRGVHFQRDRVVVHPALSAPGETDPAARRTTTVVDAIATLENDIAMVTTVSAWRLTVRWAQDPSPWSDLVVELDAQGKVTGSAIGK